MRKENKSGNEEENNGEVKEEKGKNTQKKGENGVHYANESVANNRKYYENLEIIIRSGDEYGKDIQAEEFDDERLMSLEKRRKHDVDGKLIPFDG